MERKVKGPFSKFSKNRPFKGQFSNNYNFNSNNSNGGSSNSNGGSSSSSGGLLTSIFRRWWVSGPAKIIGPICVDIFWRQLASMKPELRIGWFRLIRCRGKGVNLAGLSDTSRLAKSPTTVKSWSVFHDSGHRLVIAGHICCIKFVY